MKEGGGVGIRCQMTMLRQGLEGKKMLIAWQFIEAKVTAFPSDTSKMGPRLRIIVSRQGRTYNIDFHCYNIAGQMSPTSWIILSL